MNYRSSVAKSTRRVCLCILLAPVIALCFAIPARGHANLEGSDPAAGSVLAEPPAAVALDFSEELDTRASAVELRDSAFVVVVAGPGVIDPALPARLRLDLPPLPDGTYSAVWRVRSAIDGHITEGTTAFSVGADALPPALLPPPGSPEPATSLPAPADALARWLNFLSAAVATGSLLFGWLVWRPGFHRMQAATPQAAAPRDDADATALLKRLALIGCGAWAAATLLFVATQARLLDSGSLFEGVQIILSGRDGLLILARLLLLLLVALLAWRLPPAGNGRLFPWILASLTAAAALLTISLHSHSAALPEGQALIGIAMDWIHLLAMAAWLGGLLPLLLLLRLGRARPGWAAALVPRFTWVALPSVAILAITGTVSALLNVQTLEALLATTHGRGLGLKLGLFAVLVALGAVNLLLISPLLRREEGTAARRLVRTVRIELAAGVAVLLIVGVMTAVAPAFSALEAQNRLGFRESVRQDDVRVTLRVAPMHVGDNEFAVDVRDDRSGASQVEPTVSLRMSSEEQGIALFQVEAEPAGDGRFVARGAYLSVAGEWQIEAILRRRGFDDIRHTFDLLVEAQNHDHNSR